MKSANFTGNRLSFTHSGSCKQDVCLAVAMAHSMNRGMMVNRMNELKPCPFCGWDNAHIVADVVEREIEDGAE